MQTRFVIIMHNRDEHIFEESYELFDEYPRPEVIESYLRKSKYAFAKVEKRYSLHDIEEEHKKMNGSTETYVIHFVDENGNIESYTAFTVEDKERKEKELISAGLPFTTDILE